MSKIKTNRNWGKWGGNGIFLLKQIENIHHHRQHIPDHLTDNKNQTVKPKCINGTNGMNNRAWILFYFKFKKMVNFPMVYS